MKEIKDWNGHHVLAIPAIGHEGRSPMDEAYSAAAFALANDLGSPAGVRLCRLCPMRTEGTARARCAHPSGMLWTATTPVAEGGCHRQALIAEEYIPLVQMRLGSRP